MPKYKFTCQACNTTAEKYTSSTTKEVECPSCKSKMSREFPSNGSQKVLEVVDKFINTKHTPDQEKELKDRKTEYFWEVEVPRLVQHYSTQTCLEEGWLVYNDKGELVINKPPSKR